MTMGMVEPRPDQSGWSAWLQRDNSLVPERADDLVIASVLVMQVSGRFLYLKLTSELTELNAAEVRVLESLTRLGDTVLVATGPDPEHVRLSYRMPDLQNAVAFDADGLRGLIRQWFVWATTSASAAA
jgi:hypothetical protein